MLSELFQESKGLSSPHLVRKASINKSSGDTLKKVQTQVYPDYGAKPIPNFASNYSTLERKDSGKENHYTTLDRKYSNDVLLRRDPIDDIFIRPTINSQPIKREFSEEYYKDEIKRYNMPLKRSITDGTLREDKNGSFKATSPYSDSESLSPPGPFRTKSPEFHES